MTYRELLEKLMKLNNEQLDSDVTIYVPWDGEYCTMDDDLWFACKDHSILDENHPILYIADD